MRTRDITFLALSFLNCKRKRVIAVLKISKREVKYIHVSRTAFGPELMLITWISVPSHLLHFLISFSLVNAFEKQILPMW